MCIGEKADSNFSINLASKEQAFIQY